MRIRILKKLNFMCPEIAYPSLQLLGGCWTVQSSHHHSALCSQNSLVTLEFKVQVRCESSHPIRIFPILRLCLETPTLPHGQKLWRLKFAPQNHWKKSRIAARRWRRKTAPRRGRAALRRRPRRERTEAATETAIATISRERRRQRYLDLDS